MESKEEEPYTLLMYKHHLLVFASNSVPKRDNLIHILCHMRNEMVLSDLCIFVIVLLLIRELLY